MQRLFFGEAVQRDDLSENFRAKLAVQAGITMRMNQLVKNLLDLSALEQNEKLDLKPIDLTTLVVSVFGEFAEIIQAASIHLTLNMEEIVQLSADKEKIRRLLINLIDNSIKYNLDRDGEIQFSLSKTDNKVQMEIANTGQTIPGDEVQKVFNQFYRVEKSRSTALGGSGLGLTIVKRIVGEPDDWTRIQIVLPSAPLP